MISELRNGEDSLDYIKVLYGFPSVCYKDTIILEREKSEARSTILTSSDEAFMLFLIIVYFEDKADTYYAEFYAGMHFVLRLGWQKAGFHQWNTLYQGVKKTN